MKMPVNYPDKSILFFLLLLMLSLSITRPNSNDGNLDFNGDGEINIMVIGTNNAINGGEEFSPDQIAAELQNILAADPAITLNVNVVAEDVYRSKIVTLGLGGNGTEFNWRHYSHSLTQYYYWPEGLDARMDNLSGNGSVDWDYVVIGADPQIIASMPGFYALGVNKIAAKVAEGNAQPLLLMMWASTANSGASTAHFEEFTYRTADGAKVSLPVVPSGLAWDALPAGKKDVASVHPTPNGSYLTAATVYSHLCGDNAASSDYTYDDEIADVALATVTAEENEVHYSGERTFISPFKACDIDDQEINYNHTGTSSENGIRGGLNWVFNQVPETLQNGGDPPIDFNYGRANSNFEENKRYKVDPTRFDFSYGFPMQDHGNHGNVSMLYGIDRRLSGTMNDTDLGVARFMIAESELPYARAIPIRSLYAQMKEAIPGQSAYRDSWHMHRDLDKAIGGYMYTLLTGKCALGEEPGDPTSSAWRTWMSHKIGYETAWTLMNFDGDPPCGLVSLPVELADFAVRSADNKTAVLEWSTSTETQNEGFYIERSMDATNWNTIAFVAGEGESSIQHNYQFEDQDVVPGLYYYRLRQVDFAGAFAYSSVKSVTIVAGANPHSIRVFPNPVEIGDLSVRLADLKSVAGEAKIVDVLGRVVHRQAFNRADFRINTDNLPSGTYWLMIRVGKENWGQKIVVR